MVAVKREHREGFDRRRLFKRPKKVKAAVGFGEEMVIQLKFDRENRPDHYRHETGELAGAAGVCRRQGVDAGS